MERKVAQWTIFQVMILNLCNYYRYDIFSTSRTLERIIDSAADKNLSGCSVLRLFSKFCLFKISLSLQAVN